MRRLQSLRRVILLLGFISAPASADAVCTPNVFGGNACPGAPDIARGATTFTLEPVDDTSNHVLPQLVITGDVVMVDSGVFQQNMITNISDVVHFTCQIVNFARQCSAQMISDGDPGNFGVINNPFSFMENVGTENKEPDPAQNSDATDVTLYTACDANNNCNSYNLHSDFTVAAPEPGGFILLGAGLVGGIVKRIRR